MAIITMEASEDPSAWASCPWVAPWNGTEFATDNDIYSVARGADAEYTDQYRIMKPLVARNGVYPIQIQELETETSYTDFAALLQVDHAADVAVAPDEKGNLVAYRPDALLAPQSAVDGNGANVLALVATSNNDGYSAYTDASGSKVPDPIVRRVHGVHMGELLTSDFNTNATTGNFKDYTKEGFPANIKDCTVCHKRGEAWRKALTYFALSAMPTASRLRLKPKR